MTNLQLTNILLFLIISSVLSCSSMKSRDSNYAPSPLNTTNNIEDHFTKEDNFNEYLRRLDNKEYNPKTDHHKWFDSNYKTYESNQNKPGEDENFLKYKKFMEKEERRR